MPTLFRSFKKRCATHIIPKNLMSVEPYALEAFLTICSYWAAYVLFTPPSNFETFPAAFAIAASMQGEEWLWAMAALVGAVSKSLGLITCLRPRLIALSFVLRCFGLVISGIFWLVMGTSTVLGNPDTLMGFPGLLMGFSAIWVLFRFPIAPTER